MPHFNDGARRASTSATARSGTRPAGFSRPSSPIPARLLSTVFDEEGVHYLLDLFVPLLLLVAAAPVVLRRCGSRAGAQPAVGDAHAELDPLPLHGRCDPAADRRHRARRSEADEVAPRAARAARHDAGRRDGRGELRARRGAGVERAPRRAGVPGVRVTCGDPRPDHGPCAPADPGRRGGQRDELARLTPVRPPALPQLPVHPGRAVGGGRRDSARLRGPLGAARDREALVRLRRNPNWRLVFSDDGVLVFKRTTSSR